MSAVQTSEQIRAAVRAAGGDDRILVEAGLPPEVSEPTPRPAAPAVPRSPLDEVFAALAAHRSPRVHAAARCVRTTLDLLLDLLAERPAAPAVPTPPPVPREEVLDRQVVRELLSAIADAVRKADEQLDTPAARPAPVEAPPRLTVTGQATVNGRPQGISAEGQQRMREGQNRRFHLQGKHSRPRPACPLCQAEANSCADNFSGGDEG